LRHGVYYAFLIRRRFRSAGQSDVCVCGCVSEC